MSVWSPDPSPIPADTLSAADNKTVFTNEFERSYRCDSMLSNTLDVHTPHTGLKVTFTTTDWQVQAFDFPTGSNFTNGESV